jgi:hypothetical protein
MTFPQVGPDTDAQFLRSQCLADAANVVALAFDGEERSASDRARIDPPAAPGSSDRSLPVTDRLQGSEAGRLA